MTIRWKLQELPPPKVFKNYKKEALTQAGFHLFLVALMHNNHSNV